MRILAAILLSLVLAPAAAQAPQQQANCKPALEVLELVDAQIPIVDGFVVPADLAVKLIEMGQVQDKNFTLVIALAHGEGKFGWLFGYKNPETPKGEVLCQGGIVPESMVPAFLEIVTAPSKTPDVPGVAPQAPLKKKKLRPGEREADGTPRT